MTSSLDPILLNFIYALLGGILTLTFMWLGCKLFNHTFCFDISKELSSGNIAVGIVLSGVFVGVGAGMGLVIGLGLN
jgi:uncharacterized membrane protein YjfL (UPF0719 family)